MRKRDLLWLVGLMSIASLTTWWFRGHARQTAQSPKVVLTIDQGWSGNWDERQFYRLLNATQRRLSHVTVLRAGDQQFSVTGPPAEVAQYVELVKQLHAQASAGADVTTLALPFDPTPGHGDWGAILMLFPKLETKQVPGQNTLLVKGPKQDVLGAKVLAAWLDTPSPRP